MGKNLPGGPLAGRVALLQEGGIGLEERDRQRQRALKLADDGRLVHAAIVANYLSSVFFSSALGFSDRSFWTPSGTSTFTLPASEISLRRVRVRSTWLPWISIAAFVTTS